MAWLKVTEHYKGHFPLDGGGVLFGGYGFKEVTPDAVADHIAGSNFPYIVKCDSKGEPLVEVPPAMALPQLPAVTTVVEQAAPKSEAPVEEGPLDQNEDALSTTIEIEAKPSKKRK